jgi:hypothetical protein
MKPIDLQMKPELDSRGNPVHYIARVAPGLHIGEFVEVWMRYDYSKKTVDAHCTAMRFQDGRVKVYEPADGPATGN